MAKEAQKIVLASAARTADSNTEFTQSGTGGIIIIDVTVDPASASVTFTLQGINPITKTVYPILVSPAIAAVGISYMRVFPGATAAANTVANDFLPANLNLNANHVDGDSITYSVSFIGF